MTFEEERMIYPIRLAVMRDSIEAHAVQHMLNTKLFRIFSLRTKNMFDMRSVLSEDYAKNILELKP